MIRVWLRKAEKAVANDLESAFRTSTVSTGKNDIK